ncbi:hypothetical protein DOJK_02302 [Patescibacteria group bacterium]|nr:hypothetical protein DOJK_02302 [Patescibacteria group bacterium]
MLNLNSTINIDWRDFLHWWKHELYLLVPNKIKRLLSDNQGFLIITVNSKELFLTYQTDYQTEFLGILKRNVSAISEYQELLEIDPRFKKAKIILRLSDDYATHCELSLPSAVKENLEQVIAYELDRYTPFKTDQAYFAIKRLPKTDTNQIRVILIITNRKLFNDLCHELKSMGIIPELADYEDIENNLYYKRETYNLLPEWLSPDNKIPRLVHNSLIASLGLLFCLSLILPVWLEYQTVESLTTQVRKLEKDVKEIEVMQSDFRVLQEETQKLLNEKNDLPATYVMLNHLSQLIPDDTWLNYLQYVNGQLQIQGESPKASSLIELLEKSELFNRAAFISPVTQDSVNKKERFQLNVELKKNSPSDAND